MQIDFLDAVRVNRPTNSPTRQLYQRLFNAAPGAELDDEAEAFLRQRFAAAAAIDIDLPATPGELTDWCLARAATVGDAFQQYLAERRAGAGRRYFPTRAHALHFVRAVAPTKLVDGAWLHGLTPHWRDSRLRELIVTYLDELGGGEASHNHVSVYRRLLAEQECDCWESLPDARFLQGATQLALGRLADRMLPEVIGYNLGYEQPPLHLLITHHELNEVGINPWYFTLHVTVDNAASGHAIQAARAAQQALPILGDHETFWRRLRAGFALSELGPGSLDAITGFDLDAEVIRILRAKAVVGRCIHADRSRIGGRTVNDWLRDPAELPAFLATLERTGWIVRHADPAQSRFWQLLVGEEGAMFGVFTRYERELIAAWIRGDSSQSAAPRRPWRSARALPARAAPPLQEDEHQLLTRLAQAGDEEAAVAQLVPLLAARLHHTPLGLLATRLYSGLFRGASLSDVLAIEAKRGDGRALPRLKADEHKPDDRESSPADVETAEAVASASTGCPRMARRDLH